MINGKCEVLKLQFSEFGAVIKFFVKEALVWWHLPLSEVKEFNALASQSQPLLEGQKS